MSRRLLPCPSCARHVLLTEATCPFCHGALAFGDVPPLRMAAPGRRLSRAALYALGSSAAALAVACVSSSQAIYGAPAPPDAGYDAATNPDDPGRPLYGGAPYDSGEEDASTEDAAVDGADASESPDADAG